MATSNNTTDNPYVAQAKHRLDEMEVWQGESCRIHWPSNELDGVCVVYARDYHIKCLFADLVAFVVDAVGGDAILQAIEMISKEAIKEAVMDIQEGKEPEELQEIILNAVDDRLASIVNMDDPRNPKNEL